MPLYVSLRMGTQQISASLNVALIWNCQIRHACTWSGKIAWRRARVVNQPLSSTQNTTLAIHQCYWSGHYQPYTRYGASFSVQHLHREQKGCLNIPYLHPNPDWPHDLRCETWCHPSLMVAMDTGSMVTGDTPPTVPFGRQWPGPNMLLMHDDRIALGGTHWWGHLMGKCWSLVASWLTGWPVRIASMNGMASGAAGTVAL